MLRLHKQPLQNNERSLIQLANNTNDYRTIIDRIEKSGEKTGGLWATLEPIDMDEDFFQMIFQIHALSRLEFFRTGLAK